MDKTIVITGGAEGLGKTIAKRLVGKNKVILLDLNEKLLQKTAAELKCESVTCDITDAEQIKSVIDSIQSKQNIDVLINNAGIWIQGLLEEADDKRIKQIFEVNCLGTVLTTKSVLPNMKKRNEGTIINIVSIAGLSAKPERSIYNSSKWAMTGFTRCLQQELKGTNIRVTGIYPGFMKTKLFENAGNSRSSYDEALDPDELAKTVEFILSLNQTTFFPDITIKNINN